MREEFPQPASKGRPAPALCTLVLICSLLLPAGYAEAQLRVSSVNPRYFVLKSDTTAAIYLAGSHIYAGIMDQGTTDPPPPFDYTGYLNFLSSLHHNFFRLWTAWMTPKDGPWNRDPNHENWYYGAPYPWKRTGPGTARDGKLKFNFDSLDASFFTRLRDRVDSARARGFYVSVMLFNAWDKVGMFRKVSNPGQPGFHSVFALQNNVNGINGDVNADTSCDEIESVTHPSFPYQLTYVKAILDTLNRFDNVLYEICNETNEADTKNIWTRALIDTVHAYESRLPKSHPVGWTSNYPNGINATLFTGNNADWVSPDNLDGYQTDPPTTDTVKVIINDTDHLCGICGDRGFVWRSFTRGLNFLFMDSYDGQATGSGANYGVAGWDSTSATVVSFRKNIGYTVDYSRRMDLLNTRPANALASTGYCLFGQNRWLVYQPSSGPFTVNVSATTDSLTVEWLNLADGTRTIAANLKGGSTSVRFTPPFAGDAVLFLAPVGPPLPIEIASLSATLSGTNTVIVHWTTASERNNYGVEVQRSPEAEERFATIAGSFSPGHGTTNVSHQYSFVDTCVPSGMWLYRLRQTDLDGSVNYSSAVAATVGSDGPGGTLPREFSLRQNYPNPFNPSTTIEYTLPRASEVRLEVLNLLGQVMRTLADGLRQAGTHAVTFDAAGLPSAPYFYRLRALGTTRVGRMLIVR